MVQSDKKIMTKALSNLFPKFDKNGNGKISFFEFMITIRKINSGLGMKMSSDEIEELFNQLDSNGDGGISVEEFEKFPDLMLDRFFGGLLRQLWLLQLLYVSDGD